VTLDPEEQNQLAVFSGLTDGTSPCVCTPPLCDLELFHDIFDLSYAPLYCSCTTTN
jgi:hypothetical protein